MTFPSLLARTCSATAAPAFSISASDGTPYFSLVARSISRISAAVTIFMECPFSSRGCCLLEFAQLRRLTHGDEAVAGLNPLVRRGIETHRIATLDRQHDDAA